MIDVEAHPSYTFSDGTHYTVIKKKAEDKCPFRVAILGMPAISEKLGFEWNRD